MESVIKKIKQLAREFQYSGHGSWLNDIDWWNIPVEMRSLPNDVCGMYAFGKIWLMPCAEANAIFSTYIHELRHRWQWKMHPVAYVLGKLWRSLIEDDAVCVEESAALWIGKREVHVGEMTQPTKEEEK